MNKQPQKTYLADYKPPQFSVEKLELDFTIEENFTLVKADSQMKRVGILNPDNKDLRLEGVELELVHIAINEVALKKKQFHLYDDHLILFNVPDEFRLSITTKIYPDKNTALSGLYRSGGHYCTQCEAEGFRRITFFMDRPDVMTTYRTRISANKKRFPILLSNGNLIEEGDLPDGRHVVVWEDPFKKPSYLFALVAGDFDVLKDTFTTASGRLIQLHIYVEKGEAQEASYAMKALKKAMRWDEINYLREYDLSHYLIVSIRDFNAGAMENKGLNVFNSDYLLSSIPTATDDDHLTIDAIIGHEYFHNWSGNRITCRDWFQLSLKEGLTIFREQSFTQDTFSRGVARIREVTYLRARQFPEDAGPISHPVQPQSYIDISNFYSTTIYNKGAEIIRMIRTILGKETFLKGMLWYFDQYDGMAVTLDEFIHSFESVSGYDFTHFKTWITQAGTPQLKVKDEFNEKEGVYTLHISQETPPSLTQPTKKPLVIPIVLALLTEEGKELPLEKPYILLEKREQSFRFPQIKKKPIPSLLRGFSAPVKIFYPYTRQQIGILFQHDKDPFNRFEIGQIYAHQIIEERITAIRQNKTMPEAADFIETFKTILKEAKQAKGEHQYYLCELLTLPAEKIIADQMDVIHPQAIRQARVGLIESLASGCKEELLAIYQEMSEQGKHLVSDLSLEAMGYRRLKNTALFYLAFLKEDNLIKLAVDQMNQSLKTNMTDALAALRSLVNIDYETRERALATFYKEWQDNHRVIDKWLSQLAISLLPDTLEKVKETVKAPFFNIKNPNQVYALIGAYTQNLALFHDKEGKSYAFLTDMVIQLNKTNPYVAAAAVKPLLEWRRFDPHQQGLLVKSLEKIMSQKDLSKTVYELVHASLSR